jgi:hypothetical protein
VGRIIGEVHQLGSEGVKVLCGGQDLCVWREEAGEELRGEAARKNLFERVERRSTESDRERSMLADLVLHGADGFIEGVYDEVDCA